MAIKSSGELSRGLLGSAFSAVPSPLPGLGGAHLQSRQSVRVSSAISSYLFLDSLAADCGEKPALFEMPHDGAASDVFMGGAHGRPRHLSTWQATTNCHARRAEAAHPHGNSPRSAFCPKAEVFPLALTGPFIANTGLAAIGWSP